MQREVFEREISAALRYAEMALEDGMTGGELVRLLRLARSRLSSAIAVAQLDPGPAPEAGQ